MLSEGFSRVYSTSKLLEHFGKILFCLLLVPSFSPVTRTKIHPNPGKRQACKVLHNKLKSWPHQPSHWWRCCKEHHQICRYCKNYKLCPLLTSVFRINILLLRGSSFPPKAHVFRPLNCPVRSVDHTAKTPRIQYTPSAPSWPSAGVRVCSALSSSWIRTPSAFAEIAGPGGLLKKGIASARTTELE